MSGWRRCRRSIWFDRTANRATTYSSTRWCVTRSIRACSAKRVVLHLKIADEIERRSGNRLTEVAEVLRIIIARPTMPADFRTVLEIAGQRHIPWPARYSVLEVIQAYVSQQHIETDKVSKVPALGCDFGLGNNISLDLEPFVIKASEIIVKKLEFKSKSDQGVSFSLTDENTKRESPYALLCMVFNLVTPDSVASSVQIPVVEIEWFRGGNLPTPIYQGRYLNIPSLRKTSPRCYYARFEMCSVVDVCRLDRGHPPQTGKPARGEKGPAFGFSGLPFYLPGTRQNPSQRRTQSAPG